MNFHFIFSKIIHFHLEKKKFFLVDYDCLDLLNFMDYLNFLYNHYYHFNVLVQSYKSHNGRLSSNIQ